MSNKNHAEPELDMAPLQNFSQAEINLLLLIISYARNSEDGIIQMSFELLEDLSNYKTTAVPLFIKDLETTFDKLIELNLIIKDRAGFSLEKYKMFTGYEINGAANEPYVRINGHTKALPLVNHLDQWILDSLQEFLELSSGYSKTIFRILKKYSDTGSAFFSKADFIEQLSIPASYKQGDIDRSVLGPIEEELAPFFKDLRIKKEYGRGRGKPVAGYRITFQTKK